MDELPLTFREWLKKFIPDFEIDKQADPIVKKLGQWAWRDQKFEVPGLGHYVDKGILLCGPVGTGKSDVMRLLQKYLVWLQSPYRFQSAVVWEYAPQYRDRGHAVFSHIKKGNWYFDELALTNTEGVPYLEMINDFGNKILVGEQIIMMRYNEFKKFGWQTHFSTNLGPKQLEAIYGKRSFSRLMEMCNFIDYPGRDRRATIRPKFHSNENNYTPADPQVPTDQINIDLKEDLNSKYIQYCATDSFEHIRKSELSSAFEILKSFGIECADDSELQLLRLDVETKRMEEVKFMKPITREERARQKELVIMYNKKELDRDENLNVWVKVKMLAVELYFKKIKEEGKEKIFNL